MFKNARYGTRRYRVREWWRRLGVERKNRKALVRSTHSLLVRLERRLDGEVEAEKRKAGEWVRRAAEMKVDWDRCEHGNQTVYRLHVHMDPFLVERLMQERCMGVNAVSDFCEYAVEDLKRRLIGEIKSMNFATVAMKNEDNARRYGRGVHPFDDLGAPFKGQASTERND